MRDWKQLMAEVIAALLTAAVIALAVAALAWALGVMADAVSGALS